MQIPMIIRGALLGVVGPLARRRSDGPNQVTTTSKPPRVGPGSVLPSAVPESEPPASHCGRRKLPRGGVGKLHAAVVLPRELFSIPTDLVTRAVVQAIHDAGRRSNWDDDDGARAPTHTTRTNGGGSVVRVSVRGADHRDGTSLDTLPTLWCIVDGLDDLASDVLLVCLAQWATPGRGMGEAVWVTPEDVLGARGVRQKHYRGEPGNWRRGHRTEDRMAVGLALARLDALWLEFDVEVVPGRDRRVARRLRHESKVLAMLDALVETDDFGNRVVLGARVKPGGWAEQFSRSHLHQWGLLARRALEYDPFRRQAEKRLAKFLAFHYRLNIRHSPEAVKLRVGTLLQIAGLEVEAANPQRTRDRLERALRRLEADDIVAAWAYDAPTDLPSRGWFSTWAECTIRIEPPGEIVAQYARLGAPPRPPAILPAL